MAGLGPLRVTVPRADNDGNAGPVRQLHSIAGPGSPEGSTRPASWSRPLAGLGQGRLQEADTRSTDIRPQGYSGASSTALFLCLPAVSPIVPLFTAFPNSRGDGPRPC